MDAPCIRIWSWWNAPEHYRALHGNIGDEDWLLFCPYQMVNALVPFGLEMVINGDETSYLQGFGHVDRHVLDNGDVVVIFSH